MVQHEQNEQIAVENTTCPKVVRCCIDEEMREKEKSMLRELNNKLAVYIAKVIQYPVPLI